MGLPHNQHGPAEPGKILLWIGGILIGYSCWLLLEPFIPALAFGFALAMLGDPVFQWLEKKFHGCNAAALLTTTLICLTIVVPVIFLLRILVLEAIQGINALSSQQNLAALRATFQGNAVAGPLLRWLDLKLDLPAEAEQMARSMMQWVSRLTSSIVSGSAWAITQMVTMVVVLFYFLRDQESILLMLRGLVPLSEKETAQLFKRISETIRVSLYGKVLVSAIQGGLGGLIFWWLELPAPAFWGFVMALLSVLPVLGAFVIWVPVAVVLAFQGDWQRVVILTAWGLVVVHPVDNFLGPVLVGTRLHLHTLLTFFSVIGGLAAFGASGLVLGPVTMAIAVSLFEIRQSRLDSEVAAT